jgi:hypothetical protein
VIVLVERLMASAGSDFSLGAMLPTKTRRGVIVMTQTKGLLVKGWSTGDSIDAMEPIPHEGFSGHHFNDTSTKIEDA